MVPPVVKTRVRMESSSLWTRAGSDILISGGNVPDRHIAEPVAELGQVQAAWRHVRVLRLDVPRLLRQILQRSVERDRLDSDVAEGIVLCGRRLLYQERSLTVPEDSIAAAP